MKVQKQEWFKEIRYNDRTIIFKVPIDFKGYESEGGCEVWSSTLEQHGIDWHVFSFTFEQGISAIIEDICHIYNTVYQNTYNALTSKDRLWRDFFDKAIDKVIVEAPLEKQPESRPLVGVLQLTADEAEAIWEEFKKNIITMSTEYDRRTKEYKLWRGIIDKFHALAGDENNG